MGNNEIDRATEYHCLYCEINKRINKSLILQTRTGRNNILQSRKIKLTIHIEMKIIKQNKRNTIKMVKRNDP